MKASVGPCLWLLTRSSFCFGNRNLSRTFMCSLRTRSWKRKKGSNPNLWGPVRSSSLRWHNSLTGTCDDKRGIALDPYFRADSHKWFRTNAAGLAGDERSWNGKVNSSRAKRCVKRPVHPSATDKSMLNEAILAEKMIQPCRIFLGQSLRRISSGPLKEYMIQSCSQHTSNFKCPVALTDSRYSHGVQANDIASVMNKTLYLIP